MLQAAKQNCFLRYCLLNWQLCSLLTMWYQNLYHPLLTVNMFTCHLMWLIARSSDSVQKFVRVLQSIFRTFTKKNKNKRRFWFWLRMPLVRVEMTQQIIVIPQKTVGLKFPKLFWFYFTYWTYNCGFHWLEYLGRASWLTVKHPQFVSSLFNCCAGERPRPLWQATVCYAPAA